MPSLPLPAIMSRGAIGLIDTALRNTATATADFAFARIFATDPAMQPTADALTKADTIDDGTEMDKVLHDMTGSTQQSADNVPLAAPLPMIPGRAVAAKTPGAVPSELAIPDPAAQFVNMRGPTRPAMTTLLLDTGFQQVTGLPDTNLDLGQIAEVHDAKSAGVAVDTDLFRAGQRAQDGLLKSESPVNQTKATAPDKSAIGPQLATEAGNGTSFAALLQSSDVTRTRPNPRPSDTTDNAGPQKTGDGSNDDAVLATVPPNAKKHTAGDPGRVEIVNNLAAGQAPDEPAAWSHAMPVAKGLNQTRQQTPDLTKTNTDTQTAARIDNGQPFVSLLPPSAITPQPVLAKSTPAQHTARHVATQIAAAVTAKGDGTTEIALNPDELGRVRIHLTTTDQTLTVAIVADRAETADLMRRHVDTLVQELREQGYRQVNIDIGGQTGGGAARHDAPPPDTPITASGQPDATTDPTQPKMLRATLPGSSTLDLRL